MDTVLSYVVNFLMGTFPFSGEMQSFWMAVQGAMFVRHGPNKSGHLHWFHAFCLSVAAGYSGGWLGFLWMAKPSSMLSNDLNMGSCILAFVLVNYTPRDIGYKLFDTLPLTIVTTSFAQLFRSTAIPKFVMVCFEAFKDNPSAYYPMPVFGPIMYATLLGNMGGFLTRGFEGHVANGMPWPMQNGIFCASFFHFYVNDKTGPIGIALRRLTPIAGLFGLDDYSFAFCFVGLFMQVMGILQLPAFLGPTFSPFGHVLNPWKDSSTWLLGNKGEALIEHERRESMKEVPTQTKSKRKKKKNKAKES